MSVVVTDDRVSINRLSEAELRKALTCMPGLPSIVADRLVMLRPFADSEHCADRVNALAFEHRHNARPAIAAA